MSKVKKQKIILTRGLPASGKSSWAKEFVKNSNGKAKRINKDLLREMIDSSVYSKPNEKFILEIRDTFVKEALSNGVETIIIDDTNFEPKHFEKMQEIAKKYSELNGYDGTSFDVEVIYKDFTDISVEECIRRDAKRENPVGEKVIKSMFSRYLAPKFRPIGKNTIGNTIIVDIDGTLAHNDGHREWYDGTKVINDKPIWPIINIVNTYFEKGYNILVVSGREGTEVCRGQTAKWLDEYIKYHELFMRSEKDNREDSIIKKEIYDAHIKDRYDVEFVLDDRDQVVKLWRELGLKCLQVEPGDF